MATANAADLPVKAAPIALFNWTGFYGGINGGYSWGKSRVFIGSTPTTLSTKVDHDGGLASGEGGYCYQEIGAKTVSCLELRYDFPKEKGDATRVAGGTPVFIRTTVDPILFGPHFGVLTDRNQQLWYVAGGLAVGRIGGSINYAGGGSDVDTKWKAGWYLGLGTERMIDQHWSWKLEYDYVRIGGDDGLRTTLVGGALGGDPAKIAGKAYDNIITVGINYHFNTH